MSHHPFWTYTRQVLGFQLGQGDGGYSTVPLRPEALGPMVRQGERAGQLILLGLGAGRTAAALHAALPPQVGLTVCDLSPDQARSVSLPWLTPDGRTQLLADGSPPALASLLLMGGLMPGRAACVLNPEVSGPRARAGLKTVQTLWSGFTPATLPEGADVPSLSVAAILHPQEPDLEGFFSALPAWAAEVVVVWDAERVPERLPSCGQSVRHLAHPLERDFAAQRNRMLAACRSDWILYLDGDERLSPILAGLLPGLAGQAGCQAWAFARHRLIQRQVNQGPGRSGESGGETPGILQDGQSVCNHGCIDAKDVKMGYGLWPDLQVRLFKRLPRVRFARPVHERLEGLSGPIGLALGAPILHLTDLVKDSPALERKLALFDAAAGRGGMHRLNTQYPALPSGFFDALSPRPIAGLWPESIRI